MSIETIDATLTIVRHDKIKSTCAQAEIVSRTPIYALARKLFGLGLPEDTLLSCNWANGSLSLKPATIGKLAELTVTERDKGERRLACIACEAKLEVQA